MSRRILVATIIVAALTIVAAPLLSASSAASDPKQPAIVTAAHEVSVHAVKIGPQASLGLLERATMTGRHAPNSTINLTIGMKLRNVGELKHFLHELQVPGSPQYHKWLTPRQFTSLYGPTEAEVKAVTRFLKAQHIRVLNISPNRILIHTQARTRAYEHAFGIQINDFKLNGRSFYSTVDSPQLPHAIAPLVANVLGLNHGVLLRTHSHYKSLRSHFKGAGPRLVPPPATSSNAYFTPLQIAKAYSWPDITTSQATGAAIAIVTANMQNLASDKSAGDFWRAYGLPRHTVNVINVDGAPSVDNGRTETLLDLEYSGAMAPGATINVYVAANAHLATFTDAYNQFVIDNTSQVMTTSWGLYESAAPSQFETDEQIFMEGAAQGIAMFAAAGDNGAADNGPGNNNADYPSSSSYVTAANGTLLTIADVSGTYSSETAWSDTGGAISQLCSQPSWQSGPGVPTEGMRMNSDMALNSGSPSGHDFIVYDSTRGFGGVYGTSAVAPIFAGIFAIATSQKGSRVGQSNELIYGDVNAGNYASDFHDVTSGCNGQLPDGSPSCAATDWDHPTGWGSPKVTSLLSHIGIQGPSGTLQGTVTAATSGSAISGAVVVSGAFTTRTQNDGSYSMMLPAAATARAAIASVFGYTPDSEQVTITDGETTIQNFSLQKSPTTTISGRVIDGSGHGYGLYADVRVDAPGIGQVANVWTDPATGRYSVNLPTGHDYTLTATPVLNGYNPTSATVNNLSGATDQDLAAKVGVSCSAPGYTFADGGFGQDFNDSSFPPKAWNVTHTPAGSVTWKSSGEEPTHNGNYTGGTGAAADADSNDFGPGAGTFDTSLISPPIPVTSLPPVPILVYKANFQSFSGTDALDLDLSTDDGDSWTTLSHWTTNHGAQYAVPGVDIRVSLGALPRNGFIKLRWRYYNPSGDYDWYAQIDDVAIGTCAPIPGGLVYGQVTNAGTGSGVLAATVSNGSGDSTTTFENPADQGFPVGGYLLFVPTGNHVLTAASGPYFATADVSIVKNKILVQNFSIKRPDFTTKPSEFSLDVMVNKPVTKTLNIKNVGQGPGTYKLLEFDRPPPGAGAAVPVRTTEGRFSPASIAYSRAHGLFHGITGREQLAPFDQGDASWMPIADFPIPSEDMAAATDQFNGKVYVVGGAPATVSGYVYDPDTDSWATIAAMPAARDAPVAKLIRDKLYVANGWDSTSAGNPVAELDIYNPATDTWSTGTPNPVPAGGGSASALLDGKLYIVGGCSNGACDTAVSSVQVYDPASDSWSSAPDYPNAVAELMCGAIEGKLYCAGGSGLVVHADGYVYDPANSDAGWLPIASIPVENGGLWGSGYTSSRGELLVSGGVTDNSTTITNEGWSYDPSIDTWTALPNANEATYRGASACGFYRIGGAISSYTTVASGELLPGYDMCGSNSISIPWLAEAPKIGTVMAGATAQVALTFNGSTQQEFTASQAYLRVVGAPNELIIPLSVHWLPQPINLDVSGRVKPTGPVQKGDLLSYDLVVQNEKNDDNGAASQTELTYQVPDGMQYIAATGDAICAPSSGSAVAAAAATSSSAGTTVICNFGTVQMGASKTLLLVSQVTQNAQQVSAAFTVSAREPDSDPSNNSVTITSNSNTGPSGPAGPKGPKGESGSGGFGGLGLLALLGLAVAGEMARRRRQSTVGPVCRMISEKAMMRAMILLVGVSLFALGGVQALAASQSTQEPQSSVSYASKGLPSTLRPVLYRNLARDTGAAYYFNTTGCATLPRSALKACFDVDGAHFSASGATPLTLHLLAYGRAGNLSPVRAVRPDIEGSQVRYRYGALTEWWRALPIGFEQGFTLPTRPAGSGALVLALGANRIPERHGNGLDWGKLNYDGLVVTDANGKEVLAKLTREGSRVLIDVHDVHATYPLTVDPLVRIEQKVIASDGTQGDDFGFSVALSGATALIGASGANINGNLRQGVVYVFSDSDGVWSQTAKLTASDGATNDDFGVSVALSGNTAVVGADRASVNGNSQQGAAYVFTKSDGTWSQVAKLTASDGAARADFAHSVALSETTALIGADQTAINGNRAEGAAYVFTESNGIWSQSAKLTASDGARNDHFGQAVALSGSTSALVGAGDATINGNRFQGAAYVFSDSSAGWNQTAKLTARDGAAFDNFGASSVAFSDDTAVVGAFAATIHGNSRQGAAYVFTKSGGSWSQEAKLTASDGVAYDEFGASVALSGSTVLVGADAVDINGNSNQGAAYVFNNSSGSWKQTAKILSSDGAAQNTFGFSVALAGSTALIGADSAAVNGNIYQGAAYFYGQSTLGLIVSAPAVASAGQTLVNQAIVTNFSAAASPGVTATITVPAAASFVSANASQGNCSEDSGVVSCDFGSIGGNAGMATANVIFKAPGNVNATTLKTMAGIVRASPPLTAHAATEVNRIPVDLAISGEVSPVGPITKGSNLIYTLVVQNLSTDSSRAATQTKLIYPLPGSVEYVAASGDASCAPPSGSSAAATAASSSDTTIVCNFGTVRAKGSKLLKLTVRSTGDSASVVSTFRVSAMEPDLDPSDNSVTVTSDSSTGPTGPAGPQGPKGKKGSGGFGWLGLATLLILALIGEWGRRPMLRTRNPVKLINGGGHMRAISTSAFIFVCFAAFIFGGATTALASTPGAQLATTTQNGAYEAAKGSPTNLRPALYDSLARDAGAVYQLNKAGCEMLSRSALKACFDKDGVHFSSPQTASLVLHMFAYGRKGRLSPIESVPPEIDGSQARYRHGVLTEWWRALPIGFEQGFTLSKRPAGHGLLVLELRANRGARSDAKGVHWGSLRYGGLAVTDANGNTVPATLKSEGQKVVISVHDAQAVYPLTVDPLIWIEQKVVAGDGAASNYFGTSVAISGTTALVGAVYTQVNGNANQGAVYVFTEVNGVWSQTAKLTASDGVPMDNFGDSVALSGATALIGASSATINGNARQGAAYVFNYSEGSWSQAAKLTANDGAAFDNFGQSVALSGTTALIGADGVAVNGNFSEGAAYVFTESNGTWSQSAKLAASDGAAQNHFGLSVALDGSTALIGAYGATVNGNPFQGAAYVFDNSGGTWSQTAKLTASDGAASNYFGHSVALFGDTVLIGAYGANVNNNPSEGAAYVFTKSNGSWSQAAKLSASDGAQDDNFGSSVAISGDVALIGSDFATVNEQGSQGAVYMFTNSGGGWVQTLKLTAEDGMANDEFGTSVALFGTTTALIGADHATVNGNSRQGAAYYYGASDLDLAVSAPAAVSAGQVFVNQAIATNSSSAASPGVSTTIKVPEAASFISAIASQGSCDEDFGVVTCRFGSISGNAGTATANLTLKAPDNANATKLHTLASIVKATPALTRGGVTSVSLLPMNIAILGNVSPPGPVNKGDHLNFDISVQNLASNIEAQATETELTYRVPDGLKYLAATGDASCSPSSNSVNAPSATSAAPPSATITCDFGTLQAGGAKLVELVVQATQDLDSVTSTFAVSAEETDTDPSNNNITLSTDPDYGVPGPTGPTGPKGPKGDKGSGGLAFGGIALLTLLVLSVGAVETRKRRKRA